MKIDKDTVNKMAELARLEFDSQAKEEILVDMNNMLSFVDKLAEVDVEGVEPLIFMNDEVNHLREDESRIDITQVEALSNAPKKDMYYFRVPKVMANK
ncbi:MAG: Asp-tRNA(Asn)/Glu-tRNA(Gln) amidotransferase subunit GatC [Flavobacteriales bacterium]|nr:Asp-tRNA(Asn)/Glu-tRNA(Gln) amidotransferase subunit GatC [Flavobacteriales bacterium]